MEFPGSSMLRICLPVGGTWVWSLLWEDPTCLEANYAWVPMDRGAWQATVHGVAKELDMTEQQNHTNNSMGCADPFLLAFMKGVDTLLDPPFPPKVKRSLA